MDKNLLSGFDNVDVTKHLLAELHDDLHERVARFHMLADQSRDLALNGAMIPGGTNAYQAWIEARGSFINGHFIATVLLCQGLMEHLLASDLEGRLDPVELPPRATAKTIRAKAKEVGLISDEEEQDLERLEGLRNPLTHYRHANHPEHIDRQSLTEGVQSRKILERNAIYAISLTMRILGKSPFRL